VCAVYPRMAASLITLGAQPDRPIGAIPCNRCPGQTVRK
jgi:hypothetical protein